MTGEEPETGSERFLVTLTRARWHSLYPEWQLQLLPWQGQASQLSQGGAARLTARGLGSGPAQLPAFPAACASFLMRPQPYSLHAGGSGPSTGFSTVGNMVTGRESTTGERLKGGGGKPGPWWTECGQAGGTKVSAPQTELCLLTVPGISLFFFMQLNYRSST